MGKGLTVLLVPLVGAAVVCCGSAGVGHEKSGDAHARLHSPTHGVDTSTWQLREPDRAIAKAYAFLGLEGRAGLTTSADIVTLMEDNTPYLSEQLIGRPLWQVVVRNWATRAAASGAPVRASHTRTFDLLLDPVNGNVLKVGSRWPVGEPPMPPTVDAQEAARQMKRSAEIYRGFPEHVPKVSFLHALGSIEGAGFNPMGAKQIRAEYVMWSRLGKEPKAVWAITLRGVPPIKPPPGTPADFQDQYRHIVDAETGEWIEASNLPRLDLGGFKEDR